MLQLSFIRENIEKVAAGLLKKNYRNAALEIQQILSVDDEKRKVQQELETVLTESNKYAKEIGE